MSALQKSNKRSDALSSQTRETFYILFYCNETFTLLSEAPQSRHFEENQILFFSRVRLFILFPVVVWDYFKILTRRMVQTSHRHDNRTGIRSSGGGQTRLCKYSNVLYFWHTATSTYRKMAARVEHQVLDGTSCLAAFFLPAWRLRASGPNLWVCPSANWIWRTTFDVFTCLCDLLVPLNELCFHWRHGVGCWTCDRTLERWSLLSPFCKINNYIIIFLKYFVFNKALKRLQLHFQLEIFFFYYQKNTDPQHKPKSKSQDQTSERKNPSKWKL